MLVCANIVQVMDLLYDLLIQWQDISRLDMRRLVFFEKEQLVSCHKKGCKNRLLAGVEWGGTVGRVRHCGGGSLKLAIVGGCEGVGIV
jgi:hypothetical protein